MKDEFKKYIESETKLNEQQFQQRGIIFKIAIGLIIIGLGGAIFGVYMALSV